MDQDHHVDQDVNGKHNRPLRSRTGQQLRREQKTTNEVSGATTSTTNSKMSFLFQRFIGSRLQPEHAHQQAEYGDGHSSLTEGRRESSTKRKRWGEAAALELEALSTKD
ncbi:unnamed protein product, partial [Amoebophrya sp. A25]|eukprot:GSA25T00005313001.1